MFKIEVILQPAPTGMRAFFEVLHHKQGGAHIVGEICPILAARWMRKLAARWGKPADGRRVSILISSL